MEPISWNTLRQWGRKQRVAPREQGEQQEEARNEDILQERIAGLEADLTQLHKKRWLQDTQVELSIDKKPLTPGEVLAKIRQEEQIDIATKVQRDKRFIGKDWHRVDQPCDCEGDHNMIEVDGEALCPIKYYLILGRLALFGLTETPSKELFDALITRSME
jgi:hypothetical protein